MVHDPLSVLDAIMVSLSGFVIVFLMLAVLWGIILVVSRVVGGVSHPETAKVAAPTPAPAPKPAEPAPAPKKPFVPEVELRGVSEEEAACVMAIVCHETNIPLNQLEFKSICIKQTKQEKKEEK